MDAEDEEFNRIEMESRIKQDYVRDMKHPSREQLMAEVTVLTELVRVLSDRVAELEKTEQESVAWMTINDYGEEDDIHYENPEGHLLEGWTYKPLYTTPPTPKTQTQEPLEYWNAVEGWVKIDEVREHFDAVGCGTIYKNAGEGRAPVYTTPPQRQWVNLTDDEIKEIIGSWGDTPIKGYTRKLMDQIQDKLKEKNT